jgi:hypothetical protein
LNYLFNNIWLYVSTKPRIFLLNEGIVFKLLSFYSSFDKNHGEYYWYSTVVVYHGNGEYHWYSTVVVYHGKYHRYSKVGVYHGNTTCIVKLVCLFLKLCNINQYK